MSGIDSDWNALAVTPLDLTAMAASESIVRSGQDDQRNQNMVRDDYLGGTRPNELDVTELTGALVTASDGPAYPLRVSGERTDYESGLIRPVAATPEGTAPELLANQQLLNQVDQAFASNLAAQNYTDSYIGRIVDSRA